MNRCRTGLVIGKFYPPHAGHHLLIDTAAAVCDEVVVVVAPSSAESIPLELRLAWLREVHAGARVRFVGRHCDLPIDYHDREIWDAHEAFFRELVGDAAVDAVFSSESYGEELARRFGAAHVCVDADRAGIPVSGTAVRADPVAHWDALSAPVRAWFTRKVVVLGAESTGTTTMAAALAARLRERGGIWARTRWVPEYGRELTEVKLAAAVAADPTSTMHDLRWDRADFTEVVKAQNAAEDTALRDGSPVLVCDTDAWTTRVWEERYLGSSSPEVAAAARVPSLYLLTGHEGVPFEQDGMRDGEHLRPAMTARFRALLAAQPAPVVELRGPHEERLRTAESAVNRLLAAGWRLADPISPRG